MNKMPEAERDPASKTRSEEVVKGVEAEKGDEKAKGAKKGEIKRGREEKGKKVRALKYVKPRAQFTWTSRYIHTCWTPLRAISKVRTAAPRSFQFNNVRCKNYFFFFFMTKILGGLGKIR